LKVLQYSKTKSIVYWTGGVCIPNISYSIGEKIRESW
jgi:hypothetical protein